MSSVDPKTAAMDHIEGQEGADNVRTKHVQNVELAAAVEQQKPSLFTKRMFIVSAPANISMQERR